jgi:hypothetical protein
MPNVFDPHYDFNYKGLKINIFEIVNRFEGKVPKIVTLKLYVDGNYKMGVTFYNSALAYRRHYNMLMRKVNGVILSMKRRGITI